MMQPSSIGVLNKAAAAAVGRTEAAAVRVCMCVCTTSGVSNSQLSISLDKLLDYHL